MKYIRKLIVWLLLLIMIIPSFSTIIVSAANYDLYWPVPTSAAAIGAHSSGFGPRQSPTSGASSNHRGIDIPVSSGTKVFAAYDGEVVAVGSSNVRGNYVVLYHPEIDLSTLYQHLTEAKVSKGDSVDGGSQIAISGNTGVGTGAHLHFGVMKGKATKADNDQPSYNMAIDPLDSNIQYHPSNWKPYDDIGDKFYACIYNPESGCQLTNSDNNVNLKTASNDANQLWYFERDSDNGYKITSFVDGTCLDAENGAYSNGTNVQTYNSNSTDSQRWYFIKNGIDHYSIRTKLGNAYIDAHTSGGIIEPGANTQLYSRQDTDAQVYCFNKVNDINEYLAHDIGTDFYANIFNTSTDYLLTNTDNNVTLDSEISSGTDASQIWKFERQSNGSYVIRSASNNMCLDAEMGEAEDGTNLQIYEDNGTDAQKWVLCDTGNHSYLIKSAVGNAVADAKTSAGEIYDGTSVQLYHPNGTAAQTYDIRVIDNVSKIFAEDIGTDFKGYIINPSTGYRLTNNSSTVTLDSETENQNQIWRFERQEDNSYIIRSAVDSTCIDAANGETEDGTNVQTYEYNGTEAQRWYFYKKCDNQYTIVSSKADVVVDAKTSAGEISDGTNIQLYHPNGTDAQIYSIQMIDDEQKILGDADCDDEVTILDATVIQRHLVGIPVNTFDVTAADCDGDEVVTIIDATWIQRHLVQMAVPYSIGEPINEEVII